MYKSLFTRLDSSKLTKWGGALLAADGAIGLIWQVLVLIGKIQSTMIITMPLFISRTCLSAILKYHRTSARMGDELQRRGIDYSFGASSFWLWNILGILIMVGPFIYVHKRMKAMNLINADYNQKG